MNRFAAGKRENARSTRKYAHLRDAVKFNSENGPGTAISIPR